MAMATPPIAISGGTIAAMVETVADVDGEVVRAQAALAVTADELDGRAVAAGPPAADVLAAQAMMARHAADAAHVARLWTVAMEGLGDGWTINGSAEHRYRGNLNVRFPGLDVARLMSDLGDIAFSAGSACASGSGRPSHVLRALGLSDAEARSSIRIGFGRYTSEAELVEEVQQDRLAPGRCGRGERSSADRLVRGG